MKKSFLLDTVRAHEPKANVFANRSALLIHDLLLLEDSEFSIRGLSRQTGVSVGLVQRTIKELVYRGLVKASGTRTKKVYQLSRPGALLERWLDYYNLREKCRFYTYNSGYSGKEIEEKLKKSKERNSVVRSLHTAARELGYSFTNLETEEFYLLDSEKREKLEKLLRLEPRERGYQVLLIEPYYWHILNERSEKAEGVMISSPLLNFLDLYHFPLRGREQAEHLLRKHPVLKKLATALSKERNEREDT